MNFKFLSIATHPTLANPLTLAALLVTMLLGNNICWADERTSIRESFVNIYSGPGRGYPIFHIAVRNEWIEIIQIRTDWFKVNTQKGVTGWAYKEDLGLTLSTDGNPISFDRYIEQNYQNQRFEFGFSGGSMAKKNAMAARLSYRINPIFTAETSWLNAADDFSTSVLYNINILIHPMTFTRFTPYFTMGAGRFFTKPDDSIENGVTSYSSSLNIGAGMHYYLSSRFLLRLDYRNYYVYLSDSEIGSHQEWTTGFSFFYGSHAESLFQELFDTSLNTLDFEVGIILGSYSMEDLPANISQGLRLAYFITEDFFVEWTHMASTLKDSNYESMGFNLFSDDNDQMSYYSLVVGYNALPGEIVFRNKYDWGTQLYFVAGVGNTSIKNEDHFTVSLGAGLRITPTDNIAIHWDVRDHIFNTALFGEEKTTNNFEIQYGISYIF